MGPAVEIWLWIGVNVLVFLFALIWMPWWAALILAFCGFWVWFFVSNVDWDDLDITSWWH
jgi:hypothetical protein